MYYGLFGLLDNDMDSMKVWLEEKLQIKFQARESSYIGEYYLSRNLQNNEEFKLVYNLDPFDKLPMETEFPEYSLLLKINLTNEIRVNAVKNLVLENQQIVFLKIEFYESK